MQTQSAYGATILRNQALICKKTGFTGIRYPCAVALPKHVQVRFCVQFNAHLLTARPTMAESMTPQPSLDLIAERVERLLVRHDELQRTNALLTDQVIALTQERDLLRLRLQAARARVDALIERLPANQGE